MALDMFIKIGEYTGESKDEKHKDWIDVLAWSWGASNSGTAQMGTGAGAGKANIQDLSFTKYVDVGSCDLQKASLNGTHVPEVKIEIRKAGEKPFVYLEYKLEDVLISSFSTGGSGGEDRLTENLSLNFAKVSVTYNQQSKTGGLEKSVDYWYDIPSQTNS